MGRDADVPCGRMAGLRLWLNELDFLPK